MISSSLIIVVVVAAAGARRSSRGEGALAGRGAAANSRERSNRGAAGAGVGAWAGAGVGAWAGAGVGAWACAGAGAGRRARACASSSTSSRARFSDLAAEGGERIARAAAFAAVAALSAGVFGCVPESRLFFDPGGRPRGRFAGALASTGLSGWAGGPYFSAALAARTADAGMKFSTHRRHPRAA